MTFLSRDTIFSIAAIFGLHVCAVGSAIAQPREQPSPSVRGAEALDQFLYEKDTLANQANQSVDSADANIHALRRMARAESGDAKNEHEDMASKLEMLKDRVNADTARMSNASINDWNDRRPVVEHNLAALNAQLRNAVRITGLRLPTDMAP